MAIFLGMNLVVLPLSAVPFPIGPFSVRAGVKHWLSLCDSLPPMTTKHRIFTTPFANV